MIKYIVITNCTGRKKGEYGVSPKMDSLGCLTVEELASSWVSSLRERRMPEAYVRDYYGGRGFAEALCAADFLGAPLGVVSAGLGLVYGDEFVTPYDLTITSGPNSVRGHLVDLGLSTSDWWGALNVAWNRSYPFSRLFGFFGPVTVLVALPSTYLAMVQDELAGLDLRFVKRLRIFTSASGVANLPSELIPQVIPYDSRLESAFPGTQSDFPQRALRHFVTILNGHLLEVNQAKILVSSAMSNLRPRVLPDRKRLSDDEIRDVLRRSWSTYEGHSSKLLRYLRDTALISCEQGRFRGLWLEVRAEYSKGRP